MKSSTGEIASPSSGIKKLKRSPAARLYLRVRPHFPELMQAFMDIGWMAKDMGLSTRYNRSSTLVDLVAGGCREFCDQPDLYYSASFVDVTRGREFTVRIGRSDAVCIHAVLTSYRDGVCTQTFWATSSPELAKQAQVIRIGDAGGDPSVLDTSPHRGLCGLFIRLYFIGPFDESRCAQKPVLEMTRGGEPSHHRIPAVLSGMGRFLGIPESTVLWRFASFKLGGNRKKNEWTPTIVDHFKGFRARAKEFLVTDCGRYFSLDLKLEVGETLEILYTPPKHVWCSIAFVTVSTRTLSFMNLSTLLPESDGMIHLTVAPDGHCQGNCLSTDGRRFGSVLLREVSTDGRVLRGEQSAPVAIVRRSSAVV